MAENEPFGKGDTRSPQSIANQSHVAVGQSAFDFVCMLYNPLSYVPDFLLKPSKKE